MKSFRVQLRNSLLALSMIGLLASNILIYFGFQTLLKTYVDSRLLGLGETLVKMIERRPELLSASEGQFDSQNNEQLGKEHGQELASHSIQVLNLDGTFKWKPIDALGSPPATAEVLRKGKMGEVTYESVRTSAGMSLRRIFVPIREQGQVRYLLQADASLSLTERTLRALMSVLVLTSVAMITISWFGSDWLARKTLVTLDTLSRTAEQISESSLDDRVKLDAPYSEFQRLAYAFNSMLDRLQKAYAAQRHFVDYAAHEMQTPLTILQGNLEVTLQKSRTAEKYREVLVSNLDQVERLIRLTRSLLTLARFAGDRPPVNLAPVKLEPLLRGLVDDLAPLAEDRKISLSLEAEPVPAVLGDELRLKQLMINLLDNALRYTNPGGAITVRLRTSGDVVTVSVQDTGQGISPEHLPHLFDRFYRAESGRNQKSEGTGLGLPIAKEIATAHQGMITVESQVGKGSTFTLTLHTMNLLKPQAIRH